MYKHIWFRITKNRAPYYKYVFKGYKIEGNYDTAIVYESPYDQITALVLFCVKAKQKIQWIHFDVSKYLFHKETCRVLYPQFSQINVVSKDARESLVRLIPEIKEKTKVVYNVISKRKCIELAEIGQGYADNFKGIRILTVGRLSEEKGQEIIPEIASLLYKEGLNFRWYIIGEGYLYTEIKERIKEYNVSDCVILLGSTNNPYPFFKEADIYVQTSKHEGYGLTLAEAKVFNLPIVATNCAAAYEQLEGRKSSYVVPRESMAIVSAIIRLLT